MEGGDEHAGVEGRYPFGSNFVAVGDASPPDASG